MKDASLAGILLVAGACLCGCGGMASLGPPEKFVKPTIAVLRFENRQRSRASAGLGDSMADILVDRLLATERYHVIERAEVGTLLAELNFQQSGATRKEKRSQTGRFKNVKYLIKGTVTDFGYVGSDNSYLDSKALRLESRSKKAVMGILLYVVEVESGEVICSERLEKTIKARSFASSVSPKSMEVGGSVFMQTPLGKATSEVINDAVVKITKSLASQIWQPRIAHVDESGRIILSGGLDRKLRPMSMFDVIAAGESFYDPDTGDLLGTTSGQPLGQVRITEVQDRFSIAEIVQGQPKDFSVGQSCRKCISE